MIETHGRSPPRGRWPDPTAPRCAVHCFALLLLTAAIVSCGSESGPSRPRLVVLYATCTLNKEFLSPYGGGDRTPAFQAFADQAVVFERHMTEAGQSGVAFASIFAGTHAYRHGVYYHPTVLPESLELVSEVFADAGYETFFWSGQAMGGAGLRYGQGVPAEHIHERAKLDREGLTANDADFEALLDRLEREQELEAFVLVNFTLTHHAYQKHIPPDEFPAWRTSTAAAVGIPEAAVDNWLAFYSDHRLDLQWDPDGALEREGLSGSDVQELAGVLQAAYAYDVEQLDALFGSFVRRIDERGLADESVVAFTADHGEVLHRETALFQWTHGYQLAPEVLSVPLMIRAPGAGTGAGRFAGRFAGVTRSLDVAPTLAGLCGIEPADTWDGVNLAPALRGDVPEPELIAFSHTAVLSDHHRDSRETPWLREALFPDMDPQRMWISARRGDQLFKLRDTGAGWDVGMWDLSVDPGESVDVFDADDEAHARMAERLAHYKTRLLKGYARRASREAQLSHEEQIGLLRELGYIR